MTTDFQSAWAAHQPAIEAAAEAGMDACRQQPSDHLCVRFDCNPIEQQAVQDRLDALYEADGRQDPKHPMHCLYTGLTEAAREQEVAQ